jgi:hypothetical protein
MFRVVFPLIAYRRSTPTAVPSTMKQPSMLTVVEVISASSGVV